VRNKKKRSSAWPAAPFPRGLVTGQRLSQGKNKSTVGTTIGIGVLPSEKRKREKKGTSGRTRSQNHKSPTKRKTKSVAAAGLHKKKKKQRQKKPKRFFTEETEPLLRKHQERGKGTRKREKTALDGLRRQPERRTKLRNW